MISRVLHLVALLASAVIVVSWGLFAIDDARSATDATTAEIAGRSASRAADPTPEQELARELAHSTPREAVDDVGDVLIAPFAQIADSAGDRRVRRTVPAAIALLVYGLGLSVLARFATLR